MGKNIDYAIWVLIVILAVLVLGYLSSLGVFEKIRLKTVGKATEQEAETYADITKFYSINRSLVLASGINFSVTGTGTNDNNATNNYIGSQTEYHIGVETDSSINVDICITANDSLQDPPNSIAISNYKWSNSTSNDINNPALGNAQSLVTQDYNNASYNIAIGGISNFRFWLDVPAGQAAGIYRNKVEFAAKEVDDPCPAYT